MKELGKKAETMVKERTRKGFGVEKDNGPKTNLKGLSESYKKQRRRLSRQGKLSGETTPGKSNLTKSGKMIDSVTSSASRNEALIYIADSKSKEKAKHQSEDGRTFMNLSKTENNELLKIVEDAIKKDITKKGL